MGASSLLDTDSLFCASFNFCSAYSLRIDSSSTYLALARSRRRFLRRRYLAGSLEFQLTDLLVVGGGDDVPSFFFLKIDGGGTCDFSFSSTWKGCGAEVLVMLGEEGGVYALSVFNLLVALTTLHSPSLQSLISPCGSSPRHLRLGRSGFT